MAPCTAGHNQERFAHNFLPRINWRFWLRHNTGFAGLAFAGAGNTKFGLIIFRLA